VATILKVEDMDLLEVYVARIEADRVPLRKDPDNAGTVDAVITSPRSAGKILVDLSGHNYLSLILLLRVALPMTIHPLLFTLLGSFTVVLAQEYDRLRQLDFSQNNLSGLMHLLQVCTPILLLLKSPEY